MNNETKLEKALFEKVKTKQELEEKLDSIKIELKMVNTEIHDLNQAYRLVEGRSYPGLFEEYVPSMADLIEEVLLKNGELHIDVVLKIIAEDYNRKIKKNSAVATLVRYVQQGERFIRTGRNVFDVSKERRGNMEIEKG
ncbi:MAG: hypothetical protein ACR2MD_16950 [Aridibacter sp.]